MFCNSFVFSIYIYCIRIYEVIPMPNYFITNDIKDKFIETELLIRNKIDSFMD